MHQSLRQQMIKAFIMMVLSFIIGILSLGYGLLHFHFDIKTFCSFLLCIIALIIAFFQKKAFQTMLYGIKGENKVFHSLKKDLKGYTLMKNVHFQVNNKEAEIDTLIISERGIIILEVKNYRGILTGKENDQYWTQIKRLKNNQTTQKEVKNPIQQINRQKTLLKEYLQKHHIDCSLQSIVYIQIDEIHIKSPQIITDYQQLLTFIRHTYTKKSLTKQQMKCIKKLF